MDENIPTAEEFLDPSDELMDKHDVKEALIAFAKLHVTAALKAAADGPMKRTSILDSYPLTNIK